MVFFAEHVSPSLSSPSPRFHHCVILPFGFRFRGVDRREYGTSVICCALRCEGRRDRRGNTIGVPNRRQTPPRVFFTVS